MCCPVAVPYSASAPGTFHQAEAECYGYLFVSTGTRMEMLDHALDSHRRQAR
jgi:hypothetical protein